MQRITRRLIQAALVSTVLVGLIGFAHTKAGRPLLNALRGAPGCPVDLDGGDPTVVEAYRVKQLARVRGVTQAASRDALGFTLGKSSRDQVVAFMQTHGAGCELVRNGGLLRCERVPQGLFAEQALAVDDVVFAFDGGERLVAVDLFRKSVSSDAALAFMSAQEQVLARSVGVPTAQRGERSARYLDAQRYAHAGISYHYADVIAELSATRFGERGVRVREQYQLAL